MSRRDQDDRDRFLRALAWAAYILSLFLLAPWAFKLAGVYMEWVWK